MKLPMKLVGVKTPSYANPGDAGLDLRVQRIISKDDDQIVYGTGTHVKIPYNVVGLLIPRSSVRKYDLILSNSVGVIDSKIISF